MYTGKQIANALIERSLDSGRPLDHLRLQKLLYFCHGYYLARSGKPLLDELFEAWEFGPVLPSVYHEFKSYGRDPIARLALGYNSALGAVTIVPPPADDHLFERVLDFVWRSYGQRDPFDLVHITHEKDGPWDQSRANEKIPMRNRSIDNEKIAEYFKKFVRKRDGQLD